VPHRLPSNPATPTGALGPFPGSGTKLSDLEIRTALEREWPAAHGAGDGVLIEEVRCWRGYVRADYLYVSGGLLSIVEIKSDRDSLRRFQEQSRVYAAIADRVTLIVGWRLAARALSATPSWWDVVLAERRGSQVHFVPLRDGSPNPKVSAEALAWMLPVEEVRHVARNAGLSGTNLPGRELRELVASHLAVPELRAAVFLWLQALSRRRDDHLSCRCRQVDGRLQCST
jgi:hypothetical protein